MYKTGIDGTRGESETFPLLNSYTLIRVHVLCYYCTCH